MRVNRDIRKAVVFIGLGENPNFSPRGTGFLVNYENFVYLVTAKHVALGLREDPFQIRINLEDGDRAGFIHFDPLAGGRWFCNAGDDSIDVAIHPMNYDLRRAEYKTLPQSRFLSDTKQDELRIGPGDFTYTVGLFYLQYGAKRNLPVVHSGSISLMPEDDLVRVRDWDNPNDRKYKHIRGYLVEQQSLDGLSGSPVFVRPTYGFSDCVLPQNEELLLGLWQGSWGMDAGAILANEVGESKVPVGMGIVVPCQAIIDILKGDELTEHRADERRHRKEYEIAEPHMAATPDSLED